MTDVLWGLVDGSPARQNSCEPLQAPETLDTSSWRRALTLTGTWDSPPGSPPPPSPPAAPHLPRAPTHPPSPAREKPGPRLEPLLCGAGRGVGRAQAGLCLPRGAGSTLGRRSACTLPGWACTPRCSSPRPWWGSSSSCTDVPPSTRTSPGRRAPHPCPGIRPPRKPRPRVRALSAGALSEHRRPGRRSPVRRKTSLSIRLLLVLGRAVPPL